MPYEILQAEILAVAKPCALCKRGSPWGVNELAARLLAHEDGWDYTTETVIGVELESWYCPDCWATRGTPAAAWEPWRDVGGEAGSA